MYTYVYTVYIYIQKYVYIYIFIYLYTDDSPCIVPCKPNTVGFTIGFTTSTKRISWSLAWSYQKHKEGRHGNSSSVVESFKTLPCQCNFYGHVWAHRFPIPGKICQVGHVFFKSRATHIYPGFVTSTNFKAVFVFVQMLTSKCSILIEIMWPTTAKPLVSAQLIHTAESIWVQLQYCMTILGNQKNTGSSRTSGKIVWIQMLALRNIYIYIYLFIYIICI